MGRGGQVSVEYLLVTGFSLLLIVPLLLLFATQHDSVRSEVIEAQAHTAGIAIVESAERVYYAGPPAKETLRVRIPPDVKNITITNSSVYFRLLAPYEYDLLIPSQVPLVPGTLRPQEGPANIVVEAALPGVRITEQ